MTEIAMEVTGVSKSFGKFPVLKGISFDLNLGEIAILTGANGCGKTTLLTCLAGLLPIDRGAIRICGYDLYTNEVKVRKHMIFVPDVPQFYMEMTAYEHLQFIAHANLAAEHFDQRAEVLLTRFGLWQARHLYPHHYSRGMRLKLGLVMALIRPFDVLLLDEPTSALDGESARVLLDELHHLKQDGKCILISTHEPKLAQAFDDCHLTLRDGKVERLS